MTLKVSNASVGAARVPHIAPTPAGYPTADNVAAPAAVSSHTITDSGGGAVSTSALAAQTLPTALTDSGGGASQSAVAAGAGIYTVTIPLTSLATGLSTSAIDLLTSWVPGHKFKVLSFGFVTTVAGTGSGASQVFNLEIGTTNLTGGVLTLTLASQSAIGVLTAATAVTAANTGTASDAISLEMAAGGTVFTAGAGYFVISMQNMDVADAFASLVVRQAANAAQLAVIKATDSTLAAELVLVKADLAAARTAIANSMLKLKAAGIMAAD